MYCGGAKMLVISEYLSARPILEPLHLTRDMKLASSGDRKTRQGDFGYGRGFSVCHC